MTAACGMPGLGTKAMATFENMIQSSIKPKAVTLSAWFWLKKGDGYCMHHGRSLWESWRIVTGLATR